MKFKNPMAEILVNELRGIELGVVKIKYYDSASNIPKITIKKKNREKIDKKKKYYCVLLEIVD